MFDRIFKSKKDVKLMVVLWAAIAFMVFSLYTLFSDVAQLGWPVILILGTLLTATLALVVSMIVATRYCITKERLIVQCGPFISKIPIESIVSVTLKAKTLLSSPRLSFDTLCIHYNKYDELFISPENKTEFAETLLAIKPSIKIEDE